MGADAIGRFLDPAFRDEVVGELLKAGFKYVSLDLIGFRSGSLNDGSAERESADSRSSGALTLRSRF